MATIHSVERSIRDVEGFRVRILHLDGRDVRSDKQQVPTYTHLYDRRARDDMTVTRWKSVRFAAHYPGFRVEVVDVDGHDVHGKTLLRSVRWGYER